MCEYVCMQIESVVTGFQALHFRFLQRPSSCCHLELCNNTTTAKYYDVIVVNLILWYAHPLLFALPRPARF